jgi:hypothetical protein
MGAGHSQRGSDKRRARGSRPESNVWRRVEQVERPLQNRSIARRCQLERLR